MSRRLHCLAHNCAYNREELCSAGQIKVKGEDTQEGGNTFCSTFNYKEEESGFFSRLSDINLLSGISNMFSNEDQEMNPKVACDAGKCNYNAEGFCDAEDLNISGTSSITSQQTECETFKPL